MLFNSYEFIFLFLPVSIIFFFFLSKWKHEIAINGLVLSSLFFYGWWNPAYLALILISMGMNFFIGETLSNHYKSNRKKTGKIYLWLGILFNLTVLGYYKYATFIIDNYNLLTNSNVDIGEILLPLAISFFTFQQIAYLVDAYNGETQEFNFSHYALFVTFFPQLIAGPIVHHKEMLPQFSKTRTYQFDPGSFSIGITIFSIGLFKKVVIADGLASYATPVFDATHRGEVVSFIVAWCGTLAYTFQLYFDFSGYSEMAIGIARLFGIRLPLNFFSPYKAKSISNFWQRWHMTLSRFLRDYVYIPLGGNRNGNSRKNLNLLTTMLLGGIWHGAGWTFVIWGVLHGVYLVINNTWSTYFAPHFRPIENTIAWNIFTWCLTFLSVTIGWVYFRSDSIIAAQSLLKSMVGLNGFQLPFHYESKLGPIAIWMKNIGWQFSENDLQYFYGPPEILAIISVGIFTVLSPNTFELMIRYGPAFNFYGHKTSPENKFRLNWRLTQIWSYIAALLTVIAVFSLTKISEFLYFQF